MDGRSNSSGFTLIENMVSMVLLAVMLTGGMGFYHYSNEATKLTVHKKLATEMVSSKMEELKRQGYVSLPPVSTPEVTTLLVGGLTAQQTVTVTDIDEDSNGFTDYKQVDVKLAWTEAGRQSPREMDLTTYLVP